MFERIHMVSNIEGFIIGASVISIIFILVIIIFYIRFVLKLEKDAHCNNSNIQTAQCEQQTQYQNQNQFDFFIQKGDIKQFTIIIFCLRIK